MKYLLLLAFLPAVAAAQPKLVLIVGAAVPFESSTAAPDNTATAILQYNAVRLRWGTLYVRYEFGLANIKDKPWHEPTRQQRIAVGLIVPLIR